MNQSEPDEDVKDEDDPENKKVPLSSPIIEDLRRLMKKGKKKVGKVDAYIVTSYDAHMNEYLPAAEQRLSFLTGFTGTSGTAIILQDYAAFWTDSRFYEQAKEELEEGWEIFLAGHPEQPSEVRYLMCRLDIGAHVGSDAKLMPCAIWLSLEKELVQMDIHLVHVPNLVDALWGNAKPERELNPVHPLGLEYTGRSIGLKLRTIRDMMECNQMDIIVLTQLDDIAWVLNLRGTDVPYSPVFYAFMVISMQTIVVFMEKRRIQYKAGLHLLENNIDIQFLDYDRIYEFVTYLVDYPLIYKIWLDPTVNFLIFALVPLSKRFLSLNPVQELKSMMSHTEVECMQLAHVKDGVALAQFFTWLEDESESRGVTELEAAEKLDSFREMEHGYMGRSFPTVSAAGPHAAILNYIANPESSEIIDSQNVYLIDAGAQYLDGTTDVSRTIVLQEPAELILRECYTRVLKGLIAVSLQIFPENTKGSTLEVLAKNNLWQVGLNYSHGSGHGIGCFLYAHQSSHGISWRPIPGEIGLRPNMFLTIEPGCYLPEEFGIRIENVLRTCVYKTKFNLDEDEIFLAFETVTLCPFQKNLIEVGLLTEQEINFLNGYHYKVRTALMPVLGSRTLIAEMKWLLNNTQPIERYQEKEPTPEKED